MPPRLPQRDRAKAQRERALQDARRAYEWDHHAVEPLACIKDVPRWESFTVDYNVGFISMLSRVALNLAGAKLHQLFDAFDDLSDYDELYPVLHEPSVIPTWHEDWRFARQRIDGVNPLVLRLVTEAADLAVFGDPSLWAAFLGGRTPDACLAERRLYMVSYEMLADLPHGTLNGRRKHLPLPYGLFCWVDSGYRDRGELVPVAIQHEVSDGSRVVVTPHDGTRWQAAKLQVQIADANHHEMSSHLCRTHLVMEPFAIATPRQLAPNHPVHVLLEPHLRFLLARNEDARQRMIAPGTYVDTLLGSSLAGSLKIVARSFAGWNFYDSAFPMELERRGTFDPSALPDYPYRDDGLLHWAAIGEYVHSYLALYYTSDADVLADAELQAWAADLTSPDGGRISRLTKDGQLDTVEELAGILQRVIFTTGPLHCAVNYPQWDYLGYIPNMPLAGFGLPAATLARDADLGETLLAMLPNQKSTATQLEIIGALALYRHDRLGDYNFEDPAAQAVLATWRARLFEIEQRITTRNTKRRAPYPYLLPSLVINSISV